MMKKYDQLFTMLAEIAGRVNDGRTHNYPEGQEIVI